MKLLELLVQERVQWPDGAMWAVQDFDKELKFDEVDEPPMLPAYSCSGEVWYRNGRQHFASQYLTVRASDWSTKAVSKQAYDAAVVAAGYMCPGDATCADQGCPHHYADAGAGAYQPTPTTVQDWYAELAPIIAAAAEGKVVQYLAADGNWYNGQGAFMHPNKYRIKPEEPKTIKVNGFDVPEPTQSAPLADEQYYVAAPGYVNWYWAQSWGGFNSEQTLVRRGVLHSTKEAAVAHAKAMLGIDPYATEDADDEHA